MDEEIKISRICDTDLYGDKKIALAMNKIKGVNFMFANAILKVLGIDKNKKIDELKDEDLKKIEDAIFHPEKYNIPKWMLNRRKDYETGKDMHIVSADLDLSKKMDVKRLQEIRSRRGIRHSLGLKVRGQKTREHPRVGRAVGVKKKKKSKKAGK